MDPSTLPKFIIALSFIISTFAALIAVLRGFTSLIKWVKFKKLSKPDYTAEIIIPVESNLLDMDIYVQAFKKDGPSPNSPDGYLPAGGAQKLAKKQSSFQIFKHKLNIDCNEKYAYKFYALVKNDQVSIDKCYSILCQNGLTVTGAGEISRGNHGFYKVWFVIGNEPLIEKPASSYLLNHKLRY